MHVLGLDAELDHAVSDKPAAPFKLRFSVCSREVRGRERGQSEVHLASTRSVIYVEFGPGELLDV
jgi:hypothetical protein